MDSLQNLRVSRHLRVNDMEEFSIELQPNFTKCRWFNDTVNNRRHIECTIKPSTKTCKRAFAALLYQFQMVPYNSLLSR
jgi:hypothetical protein